MELDLMYNNASRQQFKIFSKKSFDDCNFLYYNAKLLPSLFYLNKMNKFDYNKNKMHTYLNKINEFDYNKNNMHTYLNNMYKSSRPNTLQKIFNEVNFSGAFLFGGYHIWKYYISKPNK